MIELASGRPRSLKEDSLSANAATDSNSNPITVSPNTPVVVATVLLSLTGPSPHKVFLIGHFSADTNGATGGIAVANILVNGNLMMDTQINNLQGDTGTLLSLSGVLTLAAGKQKFELQAFASNMTSASAHHRSLTAIDLG
jgi:hypothetical protein